MLAVLWAGHNTMRHSGRKSQTDARRVRAPPDLSHRGGAQQRDAQRAPYIQDYRATIPSTKAGRFIAEPISVRVPFAPILNPSMAWLPESTT